VQLERERQSMEEDKAQVDRYKQLLLKQRDIMIQVRAFTDWDVSERCKLNHYQCRNHLFARAQI
jgi:hypothetical protein